VVLLRPGFVPNSISQWYEQILRCTARIICFDEAAALVASWKASGAGLTCIARQLLAANAQIVEALYR
jgi:hypothetical protein